MHNAIQTFNFEGATVRTVTGTDGEQWFVVADMLAVLGLDRKALERIDDDEKGVSSIHTLGGEQSVTIVNESGMYSMILGSRKPEAKRFKKWVTSEVLPSIRKTGAYGHQPADPMTALKDPTVLRSMLLNYTEQVLVLQGRVDTLAPQAEALERISGADGLLNITNAAKALQVQPGRVFSYIRQNRWVYRRPGAKSDVAYQDKIEQGLLKHKTHVVERDDGSDRVCEQVMVTPKGLAVLAKLLAAA